jgi:glycosyltransferase involved in cell wall biosynthesis
MKKICILSTRHISYNPRVLKEADALCAKGYEVTVVTISNQPRQAAFDEELMQRRKWKLHTVNFRKERPDERWYWFRLSLKQRFFLFLSKISFKGGIAERAAEKAFDPLLRLARAVKADLYIVHHAEALGAGYTAARDNKAGFGFDAEDFHTGMNESATGQGPDKMIAWLEGKYLPHCTYLTAASKGIGAAYRNKYRIREPGIILNVFPFEDLPVREPREPVKFYWYSQVIGPNRGLELLLEAAAKITLPFEIHLRGSLYSDDYKNKLEELSGKSGLRDRLFLHEPILAAQLISDANRFDVGLALESDISVNRNICVTNKVFSYLMSRLLIIGTDTEGQKDIFSHFPDASRIVRKKDAEDLSEAMQFYIIHKDRLMEAKTAAASAVKRSFNWELESQKLLGYIEETLCRKF